YVFDGLKILDGEIRPTSIEFVNEDDHRIFIIFKKRPQGALQALKSTFTRLKLGQDVGRQKLLPTISFFRFCHPPSSDGIKSRPMIGCRVCHPDHKPSEVASRLFYSIEASLCLLIRCPPEKFILDGIDQ